MLVPDGVSISETARIGRTFNPPLTRETVAAQLFWPGGQMDFQRTYSTLRDRTASVMIDQRFIAVGNYNFGVYAAASGMSLSEALAGAHAIYAKQTLRGFENPRNDNLIRSGYWDYQRGNIGN
jgi:hypothetical protein